MLSFWDGVFLISLIAEHEAMAWTQVEREEDILVGSLWDVLYMGMNWL